MATLPRWSVRGVTLAAGDIDVPRFVMYLCVGGYTSLSNVLRCVAVK